MPVVSVLLPCYNASETLSEALDSLWRQSFTDFEVVAVDDGSTDHTGALLAEASRREPRLRVVTTPQSGIPDTLRTACEHAEGDLLARMDADDLAHPDRLRRQVEHLTSRPELSVSSCRVRLFPREQLKDGYLRYEAWVNSILSHDAIHRNLFVESPIPHPSVVMRRDALEAVGGYVANGRPEDYDLWMRLVLAGHRIEKLDDVLLDWRDTPGRASRVDPSFASERFTDVKELYLKAHVLEPSRPLAVWGAGNVGKDWIRRLGARYVIELDPRKLGQTIHGAEVISPDELDRHRESFIVVAVAALSRNRSTETPWRAAREDIRDVLGASGFVELRDFVCVA